MTTAMIISFGVAIFLGAAGGLLTDIGPWYKGLKRPRLNPPDWLFGPAWTIILGLAAWSAATAWSAAATDGQRQLVVALFAANALFHFLWSPLFFKLRRPDWALIEVVFLWGSIIALVIALAPISSSAVLMLVPYLAWVTFAAWLNWQIVRLNPRAADKPDQQQAPF